MVSVPLACMRTLTARQWPHMHAANAANATWQCDHCCDGKDTAVLADTCCDGDTETSQCRGAACCLACPSNPTLLQQPAHCYCQEE